MEVSAVNAGHVVVNEYGDEYRVMAKDVKGANVKLIYKNKNNKTKRTARHRLHAYEEVRLK